MILLKKVIVNFLIYLLSFLFIWYIRNDTIAINTNNIVYIKAMVCSWLFSSLLSRKFKKHTTSAISSKLYTLFIAFFLLLGLISLYFFIYSHFDVSRNNILWSVLLALLIELSFVVWEHRDKIFNNIKTRNLFFIRRKLWSFVLLLFVIVIKTESITNSVANLDVLILLLIGLLVGWVIGAFFSNMFSSKTEENYWREAWSMFKSHIILVSFSLFLSFLVRLNSTGYAELINVIFIYVLVERVISSFAYLASRPILEDVPIFSKKKNLCELQEKAVRNNNSSSNTIITEDKLPLEFQKNRLQQILRNAHLDNVNNVLEFLTNNIKLAEIEEKEVYIARTRDVFNFDILNDSKYNLIFNLDKINDIRQINKYLVKIKTKLKVDGLLIGCVEPTQFRYKKFTAVYPFYVANLFYFFDFIFHRMFPKLPILRTIYFNITKGVNRAISLAEALGRIIYCGYEIQHVTEIGNLAYFIAVKKNEEEFKVTPSYGLIFKMKRAGYKGKPIFVYKIRTMYPYSEFIQKYLYETNNLDIGGKIRNDFRVTSWGKILRKFWLDEIPMLINLFKGELKLVGVRPLSEHYLSLYPREFVEFRKEFKPGLVPPFYADLPKSLEDIVNSEKKYLETYMKDPVFTDLKYLIKIIRNISFKMARSK